MRVVDGCAEWVGGYGQGALAEVGNSREDLEQQPHLLLAAAAAATTT